MAEIVGADRLFSCIVEWGGTTSGPGRVVRDTIAPMVVGELDGEERERTRLLARCLKAVGDVAPDPQPARPDLVEAARQLLLHRAVRDLRPALRRRSPSTRTGAAPPTRSGPRASLVAEAEGLELERCSTSQPHALVERDDAALARMMAIAGNTKPSMLQDLEQGRATEVDVVNGGVAERGRAHAIPTPFNDRVVEVVHAMEEGERSPSPDELTQLVGALRSA